MGTVAFLIVFLIVTLVAWPIAVAMSVNRGGPIAAFFRRRLRVVWLLVGASWGLLALLSFSRGDGLATFQGWLSLGAAVIAFAAALFHRVSLPAGAE